MQRNTLVTLMLVIAAALLAIGLFAAGSIYGEAELLQSHQSRARCSPLLSGKRVPHRQRNSVRCASSNAGKAESARPPRERTEVGFLGGLIGMGAPVGQRSSAQT